MTTLIISLCLLLFVSLYAAMLASLLRFARPQALQVGTQIGLGKTRFLDPAA